MSGFSRRLVVESILNQICDHAAATPCKPRDRWYPTAVAGALRAQTPQQDARTAKAVWEALRRCAASSWHATRWLGYRACAGGGLDVQGADTAVLAGAAAALADRMREAAFAQEWFASRHAKDHQRKRARRHLPTPRNHAVRNLL